MVKTCCVDNCKVVWRPGEDISFFRFPIKNIDLYTKWLEIIPTNSRATEYTQICHYHFEESQYRCANGRRYLKKDAVPSIFSFNAGKIHQITSDRSKNRTLRDCQNNTMKHKSNTIHNYSIFHHYDAEKGEMSLTYKPLPSALNMMDKMIQSTPQTKDKGTQVLPKRSKVSEKEGKLRQQIRNLQQRLRNKDAKISNVCQLVKQLRKEGKCSDQLEKILLRRLSVVKPECFPNETENNNINSDKKQDEKQTDTEKKFASTLYCYSPEAYNFVRSRLNLPYEATVQTWISKSLNS